MHRKERVALRRKAADEAIVPPALTPEQWADPEHRIGDPGKGFEAFVFYGMGGNGLVLTMRDWRNETQAFGPPVTWSLHDDVPALTALCMQCLPYESRLNQGDLAKLVQLAQLHPSLAPIAAKVRAFLPPTPQTHAAHP